VSPARIISWFFEGADPEFEHIGLYVVSEEKSAGSKYSGSATITAAENDYVIPWDTGPTRSSATIVGMVST